VVIAMVEFAEEKCNELYDKICMELRVIGYKGDGVRPPTNLQNIKKPIIK
jgi:hypothetical protein